MGSGAPAFLPLRVVKLFAISPGSGGAGVGGAMVRVLCFDLRSKDINKRISAQRGIAANSASFTG